MSIKITQRNVKPTQTDIDNYKQSRGIIHKRNTNIRFGRLVAVTDQDDDG